jgi:hypothetical protein
MQAKSIKPALLGLALAASAAQADWAPAGRDAFGPAQALKQSQQFSQQIDARQTWQRSRIEAGLRDGELSHREFRALTRQQDDIAAMKRQFLSDGRLDSHEFRRLDAALDEAGRTMRAEKYDQQARWYRDYHPRYN